MLGLTWQPDLDSFIFKVTVPFTKGVVTKRLIVSRAAQLFDPLGWLSPVSITAKILIRELWEKQKLNWDDPVPEELVQKWSKYYGGLHHLSTIEIPRWIGYRSNSDSRELHGFADASEKAYAAVIFLKSIINGKVSVCLISAKTKVAPIKKVSLPRLELCAAVFLARLVTHLNEILQLQAPLYLYSDSTVVFAWIRAGNTKWKTYVSNRVSEIETLVPEATWNHVPGAENPADCASRGLPPQDLQSFSLWWQGPYWLLERVISFSSLHQTEDNDEISIEERKTAASTTIKNSTPWDLLHRYSSLDKLLKITARCFRFIAALKRRPRVVTATLTPAELLTARLWWIQQEQQRFFSSEISNLKEKIPVCLKSPLIKLSPQFDGQHLRIGGRLKHSLLSFDEKYPLILPANSYLTTLIIKETHLRCIHGGVQLTLGTLRQTYWILRGRQCVRSFIHKCFRCVRNRGNPQQQLMSDLSSLRTTPPERAFIHSGVDYAGPINVRAYKGRGHKTYKAWICIFVCFAPRAVHIELVTDYTANAFIAAYIRFTSRRGICQTLSSDQGTTFVGADRQLRKLLSESSKDFQSMSSYLSLQGTQWRFNPPAAPHFGGL